MLASALVLALGIPSAAVGFGEGRTMLVGKRNPSANSTRALNSETEIIADNGTYPVGASSGQTLAVQGGSNTANVRVDADSPTAFHLRVIC